MSASEIIYIFQKYAKTNKSFDLIIIYRCKDFCARYLWECRKIMVENGSVKISLKESKTNKMGIKDFTCKIRM